ncbi:MAG: FeoA domain-containing protein [Clostridia bacterium]|nr:FeoA domain-containing protein [Clostridia bacterium]
MPIVLAPVNTELRILRVIAEEKVKKHLENLGVVVNGTVTVLSSSGGAVVCKIKEGRVALDRDVSTKILVTPA